MNKDILVGLSGGIDSFVTAALLKNQGFRVVGLYIRMHGKKRSTYCHETFREDRAQEMSHKLKIPLNVVQHDEMFEERIVDEFIHQVVQNKSPDPCMSCHVEMRLRTLLHAATELGFQQIATGHYAQILFDTRKQIHRVHRAADRARDQSFYFFHLQQEELARIVTPLGNLTRSMVLKLSKECGLELPTEEHARSTCLRTEPQFIQFIESHIPVSLRTRGVLRFLNGVIAGQHTGMHRFYIGQSDQLPLEMDKQEKEIKLFVIGFHELDKAVLIGEEEMLYHKEALLIDVCWVRPIDQLKTTLCEAQFGPRSRAYSCSIICYENATAKIMFREPVRAMAQGQFIAFYGDDELLGGGSIEAISAPISPLWSRT